jgi:hypothetical protein
MSAIFDFLYINFGLFTKLLTIQYGSTLQNTNLAWCRIRVFLTWVFPSISTGYVLLASIDRYFSTAYHARLRSFSQIKIAYRMTWIPIILYSLTTSHGFFYYNLQPTCSPLPGTYSYFLSIYSILWTNLIPQGSLFVFGLMTYYNIKRSRQHIQNQQRNRIDLQFITITLFQILSSLILLTIRTVYYAYVLFSLNITKSSYRRAIEALLLEITSLIFYTNFGKNFFLNTLTSKLYRKVFQERLMSFYRKIIHRKAHIHPNQVDRRVYQTKFINNPIQHKVTIG